jgi:hypothetical protein
VRASGIARLVGELAVGAEQAVLTLAPPLTAAAAG